MNAILIFNGKEYVVEVPQETMKALEPPKGKYIPQLGEWYYFVYKLNDKYRIDRFICDYGSVYPTIIQNTHVFRTKEDAQEYIHYLTILDKHRFEPDWKDLEQEKYHLCYDWEDEFIDYYCQFSSQDANFTYFPSREAAKAFIAEAGEDNIKKFMFDIWEE